MPDSNHKHLGVIGGGVIGLSIARRAAQRGWIVDVYRRNNYGTSWVAGGMITPYSEGIPGEEEHLKIGIASLHLWSSFLEGLPEQIVTARETLVVGVDRADIAEMRNIQKWLATQGHHVQVCSSICELEPLLASHIQYGFCVPNEIAVDNRALLYALEQSCYEHGVRFWGPVDHLDELDHVDQIVIANGNDASRLWPSIRIRPVKGEIIRLKWRSGCLPIPHRVIRSKVHGRPTYLVPRVDGVVVGATQYESGYDRAPLAGGIRDLLNDAYTLAPGLAEYEFVEGQMGLRPMTQDNIPVVEQVDSRVIVAAGHGRNGFLLAPWTAYRVVDELLEEC